MKELNIITVFFLILTFFIIIPASSRAEDPPKKIKKIKIDTVTVKKKQIEINNQILLEQKLSGDSLSADKIPAGIPRKEMP